MQTPLSLRIVTLFGLLACGLRAADAGLAAVSRPASPEVAYELRYDPPAGQLLLTIAVSAWQPGWPAPQLNIGLAVSKKVLLTAKDARVEQAEGGRRLFHFQIDTARLSASESDLNALRWAFDVAWLNPAGAVAQRENFFVPPFWPVFQTIGDDPANWAAYNVAEHARDAESLPQIRVAWDQPMDGKASVVIEDAQGRRVRNLISGQTFATGRQVVAWDGADESGNLVAPGKFTWRVAAHPGLRPDYLMSFYNPGQPSWKAGQTSMWMGDHSAPTCAASNGELTVLGCPVAESGNNIVLVDATGRKLAEGNLSAHAGIGNVFLAMDGKRFYSFSEGAPAYGNLRRDADGKGYIYAELSLTAWTFDGQPYTFMAKADHLGGQVVREYKLDPASGIRHGGVNNLRGAVSVGSALCLSLHDENKIQLLNADTGAPTGEISVPEPGALATDGKRLVIHSGASLVLVDAVAPGAVARPIFAVKPSAPRPAQVQPVIAALAFNNRGEIFLADNGVDQNVKVYDIAGRLLRQIGRVGGRASEGAWDAGGMRLPLGLALDGKGQLWVAENESTPKRISIWKAADGAFAREIFGPTHYGASGGGFDTQDASQWAGGGARWKVDLAGKTAAIESTLYAPQKAGEPTVAFEPFSVSYVHRDGRTFLISKAAVMRLYELRADGSARLWAMLSTLHGFEAEHPRWWVPEAFTRQPLLQGVLKDFTEVVGPFGSFRNVAAEDHNREGQYLSVLWTDVNGDGMAQPEEVQVVGSEQAQLRLGAWGYQFTGLDWTLAADLGGKAALAPLKLHGFLPSGAPDWRLKEALDRATPIDGFSPRNVQSYATDRAGRFLFNADPMAAVTPDGKVAWTFPNAWTGVHGSHNAPLPETGVMQGSLSYLGIAPLDAGGDVTVINGNHGRFFVMTTDGLYLDEMFQDVRLSRETNAYRIGGECFGGFFGRDEKSGRYLLQSGHSDYRIFELHGLDRLKRFQGALEVSAGQIAAARATQAKQLAEKIRPRAAAVGPVAQVVAEWGDIKRPFPYARASASREGEDLVLTYDVHDPSPWVNQGADPQLLFKTGDAVVFEYSTDPKAALKRPEAAPGDKRLLLAPFKDQSVAVLYDYKVPGAVRPVLFNSPSRSVPVDRVTTLAHAKLSVKKSKTGYVLTARIPLADLGLPAAGKAASLRGDFGIVYGDEEGNMDILRSNWSNPATGLVNDVPGETAINPALWGDLEWK